jgi:hypothetical protein
MKSRDGSSGDRPKLGRPVGANSAPDRQQPQRWRELGIPIDAYIDLINAEQRELMAEYAQTKPERELRSRAAWYERIRTYGVAAWHTTWADTPLEERRRQIREAYEEVGEPVPAKALRGPGEPA